MDVPGLESVLENVPFDPFATPIESSPPRHESGRRSRSSRTTTPKTRSENSRSRPGNRS